MDFSDFDFYQHNMGEATSCECYRMGDGQELLETEESDNYNFGYADSCGE